MMKVIGITGGIGAGKSQALQYMQEKWGAYVCYADNIGHTLQEPDEMCYKKIVDFFGVQILGNDKRIDRSKLAKIIFSDEEKRLALNSIMHPCVKERICELIQAEKEKGTKCFLLEAALLIEDDYGQICNELWYIYAPEDKRRERLKQVRGYTDEKIEKIFLSQLSEEEYRAHCRYVIDNSGTFEKMYEQIDTLENRQDETM